MERIVVDMQSGEQWTVPLEGAELAAWQAAEEVRVANLDADTRAEWRQRIDDVANAVHGAALPFTHALIEYLQAEAAAAGFRAQGYAGAVPREVAAESDAKGASAQAATDGILAKATALRALNAEVRYVRLNGKAAVNAAIGDAIATTGQLIVDQLRAMIPTD